MDCEDLVSESESDDEESHDETPSTSKKRKHTPRDQPFMDNWLEVPEFKGWLTKRLSGRKMKPYCNLCEKFLTCSKTGVKRHKLSKKHQENLNSKSRTSSIRQMMNQATTADASTSMEVKLCAFVAQHNMPLSLTDDMVRLLRSLFPNDAALKNVRLGKQKATNIVRQVLGFNYVKEMVSLLRCKFFSIIIDEATDQSTKKQLAILANFFDIEKFKMDYWLVDMVEADDGTALGIYTQLKETFNDLHIPMTRIIGYSSDTTNVMFGQYNSVAQLLKSDLKSIQVVKCSCHPIHLVSSYAALKLPKSVEDLCRDLYAHFHRSSKRQDVYKEFQAFFGVDPLKILSPAQTRWLSLQECVNRILEQYEALKNYFVLTANTDPSHTNDRILASLQNHFTQAYLEFLSYQLERLNAFNRLFQSEQPLLHNLKHEVEELVKSIASDFIELGIVKTTVVKDLDPSDLTQHVPLHQTYVGVAATTTIQSLKDKAKDEDINKFLIDCKNFLIESIIQIKSRFDLNAEYHDLVECLQPQNATNLKPRSLARICEKMPCLKEVLDTSKLDLEWRLQALDEKLNANLPWDEYWLAVRDAQTPMREPKYPNLIKFFAILSSLPVSNAAVERMFSQLKLVKINHRNSLKSMSLVSLLQSKLNLKNQRVTAASLQPGKELLKLARDAKSDATEEEVKGLRKELLKEI